MLNTIQDCEKEIVFGFEFFHKHKYNPTILSFGRPTTLRAFMRLR
jgi:hypothetical protein